MTEPASTWTSLLPAGRRYLAIPSRRHPLVIASLDRAVLGYLAGAVLSVPPGAGPVRSLLLTLGLRLFRCWPVRPPAAALRAGGVLLTGDRS